jgi:hypothetical protein
MDKEPVLYREEVTATLWVLADLNVNLTIIRMLLEDGLGEAEEDDS